MKRVAKYISGLLLGAVVLLLVGSATLYFGRSSRAFLEQVRQHLVPAVRRALHTDFTVARLSGDPLHGIQLEQVRLGKAQQSPTGALVTARRVELHYSGLAILLRRRPPISDVQSITIDDYQVFLHRRRDGRWNFADLIPPKREKKPPQPFHGHVLLRRGTVIVVDERLRDSHSRPLRLTFELPEVTADGRDWPNVAVVAALRERESRMRRLDLHGTYNDDAKTVKAVFDLQSANIDRVAACLLPPSQATIAGGMISGTGTVNVDFLHPDAFSVEFAHHLRLTARTVATTRLRRPLDGVSLGIDGTGAVKLEKTKPVALQRTGGTKISYRIDSAVTGRSAGIDSLRGQIHVDSREHAVGGNLSVSGVDLASFARTVPAALPVQPSGTADVATRFQLRSPLRKPAELSLNGTLNLTRTMLTGRALPVAVHGLHTAARYDLAVVLSPRPQVTGTIGADLGANLVDELAFHTTFTDGGDRAAGAVQFRGVDIGQLHRLIKTTKVKLPRGRADGSLRFVVAEPLRHPAVTFRGDVRGSGVELVITALHRALPPVGVEGNVEGGLESSPAGRTGGHTKFTLNFSARSRTLAFQSATGKLTVADGFHGRFLMQGLNAAYWSKVFVSPRIAEVTGGTGHADFQVTKVHGHTTYHGVVRMSGGVVKLPQLRRPVQDVAGELTMAGKKAYLTQASGRFGDSPLTATGTISLSHTADLNLIARSQRIDVPQVLAAVPTRVRLPKLTPDGFGQARVTVTGPGRHPMIAGAVFLPAADVSDESFGSAHFPATIANLRIETQPTPTVNVDTSFANVDLSAVHLAATAGLPTAIRWPRNALIKLQVSGPWHDLMVGAGVQMRGVQFAGRRFAVDSILGYTKAGVRIEALRAATGASAVDASGQVDLKDTPQIELTGKVRDLPLDLASPWLEPQHAEITGTVNGPFALQGPLNDMAATGRLDVDSTEARFFAAPSDPHAKPVLRNRLRFAHLSTDAVVHLRRYHGTGPLTVTATAGVAVHDLLAVLGPEQNRVLPVDDLVGSLTYENGTVSSKRLTADLLGGSLELTDVRYDLGRGVYGGTIAARGLALAQASGVTGRDDLKGVVSCSGALEGSGLEPTGALRLAVTDGTIADFPIPRVDALIGLSPQTIVLNHLDVRGAGGSLQAWGAVHDFDVAKLDGTLSVDVRAAGVQTGEILHRVADTDFVSGPLSLTGRLGGTLRKPAATLITQVKPCAIGDMQIGDVSTRLELQEDRIAVHSFRLTEGEANLIGAGTIDRKQGWNLQFSGRQVPFRTILLAAGLKSDATGTADLTGAATGSWNKPLIKVQLDTTDLALEKQPFGSLHATAEYHDGRLAVNPVLFQQGDASLTITGNTLLQAEAKPVDATVILAGERIRHLLPLAQEIADLLRRNNQPSAGLEDVLQKIARLPNDPRGMIDGKLVLGGFIDHPQVRLNATFSRAWLGLYRMPHINVSLVLDQRLIRIEKFLADVDETNATMTGTVSLDGPISLNLDVHNASLAFIEPWMKDPPRFDGSADLTLQARGTFRQPQLTGSLEVINPSVKLVHLDRIRLNLFTLKEGEFRIDAGDLMLIKGQQRASLSCIFPFGWSPFGIRTDQPFHFMASLPNGDLSSLEELMPNGPEIGGGFQIELQGKGTVHEPQLGGKLTVTEGRVTMPGLDTGVHDLKVDVRLDPKTRTIQIRQFAGRLGLDQKDGAAAPPDNFHLDGTVALTRTGIIDPLSNIFDLRFAMDHAALQLPNFDPFTNLSSRVSLTTDTAHQRDLLNLQSLHLEGDSGSLDASGTASLYPQPVQEKLGLPPLEYNAKVHTDQLEIRHKLMGWAHFDSDLSIASTAKSLVPQVKGRVVVSDAEVRMAPPTSARPSSAVPPQEPVFDINVDLGDDVRLWHPVMNAPVTGGFTITGTPAHLVVSGSLNADRGTVRFPAATAQIESAHVTVHLHRAANGSLIPSVRVDIHATAETGGTKVSILMRGPLPLNDLVSSNDLNLTLTSTPPMPEDEIYALLFGISGEGGGVTPGLGREAFARAFGQKVLGMLASQAGSALSAKLREITGFDVFDVVLDKEGFSQLEIRKQLGKLNVGVKQALGTGSTGTTLDADLALTDNVILGWAQDPFRTTVNIEFRFQF